MNFNLFLFFSIGSFARDKIPKLYENQWGMTTPKGANTINLTTLLNYQKVQ
mgnify:FL=1